MAPKRKIPSSIAKRTRTSKFKKTSEGSKSSSSEGIPPPPSSSVSRSKGKRPAVVLDSSDSDDHHPSRDSPSPQPNVSSLSSPPSSWFKSHQAKGLWLDGYHNRQITFCDQISEEFIDSSSLACLSLFKSSTLWKIANPGTIAYPSLTRLFYLNLVAKRDHKDLVLETNIKGKILTLTKSCLAHIFGTPQHLSTDSHPSRLECVSGARNSLFLSSENRPKEPTHYSEFGRQGSS